MSEKNFRAGIYKSHKAHFDHVYRLHRIAEEAMLSFRHHVRGPYEDALSFIFPRAYKSFDSIRRLCEVASCEDAAVILRSLLNLLVVTRWISMEPSGRSRKYLHWFWIQMYRDAQTFKDTISPKSMAIIEDRYKRVKSQFESEDKKGKRRQAKTWYEPEALNIRDLFVQVGLETQYEQGYRPLSGIEHSDATAFFAMVKAMERSGTELRLNVQSDLFVPHYLRNAFQYFGDIFEICNRTIPLTDDQKLKSIIAEGRKVYKADMEARGIPP